MGIKHSVLKIQSHNAQDYKFLWEEHYNDVNISESGITTLETGCQLIFDDENCAGKQEFHR